MGHPALLTQEDSFGKRSIQLAVADLGKEAFGADLAAFENEFETVER